MTRYVNNETLAPYPHQIMGVMGNAVLVIVEAAAFTLLAIGQFGNDAIMHLRESERHTG